MDENCMENGAHKSANNGFDGESGQEDISDTERNVDDTSETEQAKLLLYNGIQKLVQDSVQEIKKSRTERKKKRKRVIANVGEPCVNEKDANAYSRCSLPYLAKVITSIKCSEHKISLVRKIGFEDTLHIDDCYIPRLFAQWLADNTLPDEEIMKFGDRTIPINPQSFVDVLGIPAGPLPVETDEDFGKAAFLEFFSLSEIPTIKYLGDKIINEENIGDDEFCICYGAVVMSAFICPNSSPRPSTKYMGALVDVANMKNRNWSLFAHRWMMCYIKKYLKERQKKDKLTITLGGCIYQHSVRYLDFIDLAPIKLPSTLPRIRVWKGNLIKHFSQMDKRDNGNYGSHIVRDVSETCYARPIVGSPLINGGLHHLKNEMERVAGDRMSDKVKNELFEAFQNHMFGAESEPYLRAQLLVIDMMKIITSEGVNKPTSEITVPLSQGSSKQDCEAPMKKKHKFDVNSTIDQLSQTDAGLGCSPNAKKGDSDPQQHMRQHDTEKNDVSAGEENDVQHSPRRVRCFSLNHTWSGDDGATSTYNKQHCSMQQQANGPSVDATNQAKTAEATLTQMKSLSLNHTISSDDGISSPSSSYKKVKQSVLHKDDVPLNEGEGTHQAHYIQNMQTIAKEYIGRDSTYKGFSSKEEFMKEMSKKYYFKDDSYPSMRFFEWEDDNGKIIEEEELWKPLPGDTVEPDNKSCHQARTNAKKDHSKVSNKEKVSLVDGSSSFAYSPPKHNTPAYVSNPNSEFEFSSIQCGQRQPPSNNPPQTEEKVTPEDNKKEIIDLDEIPSQPSQFTPLSEQPLNGNSVIRGRRLFHDGTSNDENDINVCTPSSNQKLKQHISPDVEYLGERSFNSVCNNMAATTDELYNAVLTLGSARLPYGKENLPPKRVINRSVWLCSPYERNLTPAIEPKHTRLHEILTTLCDDESYKYKYIINIGKCKVYLGQVGSSMKMNGHVEAWFVNAMCRKMFKDNHPKNSNTHWFFHTSSEYFLQKWPNDFMKNKWKVNTLNGFHGANSAKPLAESDRLHFPSLFEGHWFLFLVDLLAHKFLFLDSFYGEDSSYHKRIDIMMINNFRRTWDECGFEDKGFGNFDIFFPNVPKQKTGNDCGIFMLKFMEFYRTRNPAWCAFSSSDIPSFRVQLAVDSVWNQYNTELDNMYLVSSFDLESYKRRKLAST